MADPTTLGPYVVGEIPPALQYQFLDSDGNAVNLTGYTIKYLWQRRRTTSPTTRDATLTTAASGIVTYTFVEADLAAAGVYEGRFWAGNGTNRYASVLFIYEVSEGPGDAPDI